MSSFSTDFSNPWRPAAILENFEFSMMAEHPLRICTTGDPIHFMFGSTVRFSGSTEWLHQIQVGGRPPSWIISNGRICATAHSIRLYSAHRAVIFAIAQLSCYSLLLLTTLLSNFARGSTVLLRVKTNI